MFDNRDHLFGKRNCLLGLILLWFMVLVFVAFGAEDSDEFTADRREVLLRKIGHELLLQSGDSLSRVLPVQKIAENEYQIMFENDLTFQPESLMYTTQRLLAKDPLITDYVVSVLLCGNSSVTYGFAISKNNKEDIAACEGRKQPSACYKINFRFKPKESILTTSRYLLTGIPFLAFVGFIFFRYLKPKTLPFEKSTDTFMLGTVLFDAANKKLVLNEKTIDLTGTENRVLLIFAVSPNKTIERSRLQKEIWEDEGVIVGRSLDMFISKLRKKLEIDPNIKIVVIRSKGYKLEVSA